MICYLLLLASCILYAQNDTSWPISQTNTYEILGGADLGVLIPVADYQFKGRSQSSDPIVWLNEYEHLEDSSIRFTLIFDPFDGPCDVDSFLKWCLINGNFMGMDDLLKIAKVKRSEALLAGEKKDIPVRRLTFEYKDLIVEQLFLTVGNYGYCILATYPVQEESQKSKYWDFFVSNTLPWIEKT